GRMMAASEWSTQVPDAPCDVTMTYTDGMGSDTRHYRYDREGRLVYGETRLTYDGRGFEHLTWQGGQLLHVASYYEQAVRAGMCEVMGGCDEPAYREIAHTDLAYAGGRLARESTETLSFHHPKGDAAAWQLVDRKGDGDDYEYNNGYLASASDVDFAFANGKP